MHHLGHRVCDLLAESQLDGANHHCCLHHGHGYGPGARGSGAGGGGRACGGGEIQKRVVRGDSSEVVRGDSTSERGTGGFCGSP